LCTFWFKELTDEEVASLKDTVNQAYGVDEGDYNMRVVYETSGILDVAVPSGMSQSEAIALLETELASILGVPVSAVSVGVNESGQYVYTVTQDKFAFAETAKTTLEGSTVASELSSSLSSSGLVVNSLNPDTDIVALLGNILLDRFFTCNLTTFCTQTLTSIWTKLAWQV